MANTKGRRNQSPACPPDPYKLYVWAESFQTATDVLYDESLKPDKKRLSIPLLVMGAFKLELYLKCLLMVETGSYPEDHRFNNLFNALPLSVQANIRKQWNDFHKVHSSYAHQLKQSKTLPDLELSTALELCQNVFHDSRYQWEERNRGPYYLVPLEKIVRKMIWTKRPEWVEQLNSQKKDLVEIEDNRKK